MGGVRESGPFGSESPQVLPRFCIHDYGIKMLQILLSEHLFSWPVQGLSLLVYFFKYFFSVPQNKVAEIRGEKIG